MVNHFHFSCKIELICVRCVGEFSNWSGVIVSGLATHRPSVSQHRVVHRNKNKWHAQVYFWGDTVSEPPLSHFVVSAAVFLEQRWQETTDETSNTVILTRLQRGNSERNVLLHDICSGMRLKRLNDCCSRPGFVLSLAMCTGKSNIILRNEWQQTCTQTFTNNKPIVQNEG